VGGEFRRELIDGKVGPMMELVSGVDKKIRLREVVYKL
jgi:hypothetical protein